MQLKEVGGKGTGVMMTPKYTQQYRVLARNRANELADHEHLRLTNSQRCA